MRISEVHDYEMINRVEENGNVYYFDDDGKLHRDDDLPAVEFKDGKKEYWKHGEQYNPIGSTLKKRPTVKKTPIDNTSGYRLELTHPDGTVEHALQLGDGTVQFFNDAGHIHRDGDFPAVIMPDGSKAWYKDNVKHRDNDLPAVVRASGTEEWYCNGLRHRDGDKPAIITAYGEETYYRNGGQYYPKNPPSTEKWL